ncbi:MAG TPA: NepR family anti-sigma factor [Shinella sp.]|uniref:NepR family anti-sigma factor n=1 Tax=Shinella sp. TaxID=1870904 RepID=UPI0029A11D61|nr:NepR family anti-sigma factor [Shinella sp.]MDX3978180.1 NepR family anti-sigma factor [Shinella sp.]HEV7248886.1 NepR family anti-sigma factor [Shinella sp.]
MEHKTNTAKPRKRPDDPNAQIATKLRAFYHSVQDETLPQRFLDLLEKLDAVENSAQRAE